MLFLKTTFRFLKKLAIFMLIMSIAIPLQYRSINHQYLGLRSMHSILSLTYSVVPDQIRPTLSADYRAFETIVRLNPIAEDDPLTDARIIIQNLRSTFVISTIVPKPAQCQITNELFQHDGHTVNTYWVDNHQRKFQRHADQLILFFHGGGYIMGNIHSHSGIECHLSELFNTTILHVEYRLIPEHPLPAAVDDAIAIYSALLQNKISPLQILIMGESAGGGLALLTVQALIARQLPVPRGVILLSPWTDLSISGESYTRNDKIDVMLRTDNMKWVTAQLLDSNHSQLTLSDPLVSPLFGSFRGFPPMYINVGTAEILEDDSRGVVQKAKHAGVNVTFEEGLHMMHVYPIFFPYYPEARNTLHNIHKWIQTIFI